MHWTLRTSSTALVIAVGIGATHHMLTAEHRRQASDRSGATMRRRVSNGSRCIATNQPSNTRTRHIPLLPPLRPVPGMRRPQHTKHKRWALRRTVRDRRRPCSCSSMLRAYCRRRGSRCLIRGRTYEIRYSFCACFFWPEFLYLPYLTSRCTQKVLIRYHGLITVMVSFARFS